MPYYFPSLSQVSSPSTSMTTPSSSTRQVPSSTNYSTSMTTLSPNTSQNPTTRTNYSTVLSGLRLQVTLNTTTMPRGGAVTAQISLFNTLDRNLSLAVIPSANSTLVNWGNYDFICGGELFGSFTTTLGYALLSGHYTPANFSLASTPLQLAPSVGMSCAHWPSPERIVFPPHSDNSLFFGPGMNGTPEQARVNATTEYCTTSDRSTAHCGAGEAISGYWDMPTIVAPVNATINSTYFIRLPPGQYTLEVADIWGQTIFAYFRVV